MEELLTVLKSKYFVEVYKRIPKVYLKLWTTEQLIEFVSGVLDTVEAINLLPSIVTTSRVKIPELPVLDAATELMSCFQHPDMVGFLNTFVIRSRRLQYINSNVLVRFFYKILIDDTHNKTFNSSVCMDVV